MANCCSLCDISNKVFLLGQIESVLKLKFVAAAAGRRHTPFLSHSSSRRTRGHQQHVPLCFPCWRNQLYSIFPTSWSSKTAAKHQDQMVGKQGWMVLLEPKVASGLMFATSVFLET